MMSEKAKITTARMLGDGDRKDDAHERAERSETVDQRRVLSSVNPSEELIKSEIDENEIANHGG